MAAEKTTIATKTTGDQLSATEFNDINDKYNATVDVVNAIPVITDTDDVTEGSNLYFTDARAANAPASEMTDTTKKELNSELGVPVNVKHYGAVGDGVTDDTAAIQSAIDTGQNVYIDKNTYLITDSLVISTSRQKLNCDGILLLGGASGTAAIQVGIAGGDAISELDIYINTIEGQDNTSGRDGIAYRYCTTSKIWVAKINNCRYGHHIKQTTDTDRFVHNNIGGVIIRACDIGIYHEDATGGVSVADNEGSDYEVNLITGCVTAGMKIDSLVQTNGSIIKINFDAGSNFYINNSEYGQPNILLCTDLPEPFSSNTLSSRDILICDGNLIIGRRSGRNTIVKLDVDSAQTGIIQFFRDGVESGRIGHNSSSDFTFSAGSSASAQMDLIASNGVRLRNRIFFDGSANRTLSSGNNNNVDPGASCYMWRLTGDVATSTITGIAGGGQGRTLKIYNVSSNDVILSNEDANSSSGNRILSGSGASVTLSQNDSATLTYDATTSRWRIDSVFI